MNYCGHCTRGFGPMHVLKELVVTVIQLFSIENNVTYIIIVHAKFGEKRKD